MGNRRNGIQKSYDNLVTNAINEYRFGGQAFNALNEDVFRVYVAN